VVLAQPPVLEDVVAAEDVHSGDRRRRKGVEGGPDGQAEEPPFQVRIARSIPVFAGSGGLAQGGTKPDHALGLPADRDPAVLALVEPPGGGGPEIIGPAQGRDGEPGKLVISPACCISEACVSDLVTPKDQNSAELDLPWRSR
jgi:hypothetical protein